MSCTCTTTVHSDPQVHPDHQDPRDQKDHLEHLVYQETSVTMVSPEITVHVERREKMETTETQGPQEKLVPRDHQENKVFPDKLDSPVFKAPSDSRENEEPKVQ